MLVGLHRRIEVILVVPMPSFAQGEGARKVFCIIMGNLRVTWPMRVRLLRHHLGKGKRHGWGSISANPSLLHAVKTYISGQ